MRRVCLPVVTAVAVAGLGSVLLAGVGPVVAGVPSAGAGGWNKAIQVPGTAALNKGGIAEVRSVSCAPAGGCAAGGRFKAFGHLQAFVVTEAGGRWRTAIKVPGTAALNKGGRANVRSVSCAAASSCAAGGFYRDGSGHAQAFVVTEAGGRWRTAIEVPGTAALNKGGNAAITSVSCAAAGGCAAGGTYRDGSGHQQAFVATEAGGRWRTAIEVPGMAALNAGGDTGITSVSCAAAGGCAAGGTYRDGSGHQQAFVVTEAAGQWGTAIEVPGTAALNTGGDGEVHSVSCAAAGSCAAGGIYHDGSGHQQAFVVTEAGGQWGTALEVPGTAALNTGGDARLLSVSCSAAGSCAAGGAYSEASLHLQAFVVTEAGGKWGTAIEVPGTAALNSDGVAEIRSVSCSAAGSCAAGGLYLDASHHGQAFVVTEAGGQWGTAIEVPGTAGLNKGGSALINSVSCAAAGSCAAGGYYRDGSGHLQAFVVSKP